VIALDHAGIKGLPDFLNVVIMIGIVAIAVESIYIAPRALGALSAQGIIPKFISRVDSKDDLVELWPLPSASRLC
jgi:amino acid transporter